MEKPSPRSGAVSIAPYAFLFLSGAAALACEVVWVRLLADVFGTTAGARKAPEIFLQSRI